MSTLAEAASSGSSTPATAATAATGAIAAALTSAVALLALHFLSPEPDPSWRMVSEYAVGRYGWLLTVVFVTWALAYWALAVAAWRISAGWLGWIGLALLVLAGVGEMMSAGTTAGPIACSSRPPISGSSSPRWR